MVKKTSKIIARLFYSNILSIDRQVPPYFSLISEGYFCVQKIIEEFFKKVGKEQADFL